MATNRKTDKEMSSSASKIWKENPPGPEQKELNRLFENKMINESQTPNNVRQSNPLFMAFSARVFSTHFRKTKAKYGLYATGADPCDEDKDGGIPELTGTSTSTSRTQILSDELYDIIPDGDIEIQNPPFMTWIYTDHDLKGDFVCVALPIISGSRDINFSLSQDGMKLVISYTWPSALYTPSQLFHDKLNDAVNPVSLNHPKIHSFTSHLLECNLTENAKPRGSFIINLPLKVQRELGTWKKYGVKCDDTKIIMLEFKAFQKKVIIEDADTSITF